MPNEFANKIILNSISGYSEKHDLLLTDLVNSGVKLFCTVGKTASFGMIL
jgi:hypothetical protein